MPRGQGQAVLRLPHTYLPKPFLSHAFHTHIHTCMTHIALHACVVPVP